MSFDKVWQFTHIDYWTNLKTYHLTQGFTVKDNLKQFSQVYFACWGLAVVGVQASAEKVARQKWSSALGPAHLTHPHSNWPKLQQISAKFVNFYLGGWQTGGRSCSIWSIFSDSYRRTVMPDIFDAWQAAAASSCWGSGHNQNLTSKRHSPLTQAEVKMRRTG